MEKSKVYFMDFETNVSLLVKFKTLLTKMGFNDVDLNKKYVAIKLHFGEPGNLAYIRPNYVRVVGDLIKENKGIAFLTDANTLYVGKRKNAIEHIESAYLNGFNPFVTGCQVIIADGVKGTDDVELEVNGEFVKTAKVGRAICDADIIVSMNHVKGHGLAGFGGAIKNIGMGCASRAGKYELHSSGKPVVRSSNCKACGICIKNCAHEAISIVDNIASIDDKKCLCCGRCIGICLFDAIKVDWNEGSTNMNKKTVEYTHAILKDKIGIHINFIMDVSPDCDCESCNNRPFVGNIGILASFDPLAIDKASVDLINQATLINGYKKTQDTNIKSIHKNTNYEALFEHGVKMKLGNLDYELVKI